MVEVDLASLSDSFSSRRLSSKIEAEVVSKRQISKLVKTPFVQYGISKADPVNDEAIKCQYKFCDFFVSRYK